MTANPSDRLDRLVGRLAESIAAGIGAKLDMALDRIERVDEMLADWRRNDSVRPALLTRTETGKYLGGLCPRTIDSMRASGGLPCVMIGSRPMFLIADLDAYLESRRERRPAKQPGAETA